MEGPSKLSEKKNKAKKKKRKKGGWRHEMSEIWRRLRPLLDKLLHSAAVIKSIRRRHAR